MKKDNYTRSEKLKEYQQQRRLNGLSAEAGVETDPIYSASAAATIVAGDITNWNTAYSSLGNYLPLAGGTLTGALVGTTIDANLGFNVPIGQAYKTGGVVTLESNNTTGGGRLGYSNTFASSGWAIGYGNTATGNLSPAVGASNTASGFLSCAIGFSNTADAVNACSIGYTNAAHGSSSVSLGYGCTTDAAATNAVAMGKSVTNSTAGSLEIGPSNTAKMSMLSTGATTFPLTVQSTGFLGPLTGDVTGNVSGNAGTATLATDSSAVGGKSLQQLTRADVYEADVDMNSLTDSSRVTSVSALTNTPFGASWYNLINIRHRGGSGDGDLYGGQLAFGMTSYQDKIAFRGETNGTWGAWKELWHSGNDGTGSGLDADLLDGQHGSYYSPTTHNHDAAYAPIAHVGATGTAHGDATTAVSGFMSAADKTKLDGVATGAEVNQNAFSTVAVSGQTSVAADTTTDTLTLVAGTNITITTDAATDSITINSAAGSSMPTGGGTDAIFYENGQTVNTDYTIGTNKNAMSAGPITIATGVTVTVPTGSTWVIV